MAHKSFEQLQTELNEAKKTIIPGSKYSHYKHPQVPYTISDIVIEEATDEPMVLYRNNEGITFARPFKSFVEKIEVDGIITSRFSLLQ